MKSIKQDQLESVLGTAPKLCLQLGLTLGIFHKETQRSNGFPRDFALLNFYESIRTGARYHAAGLYPPLFPRSKL